MLAIRPRKGENEVRMEKVGIEVWVRKNSLLPQIGEGRVKGDGGAFS